MSYGHAERTLATIRLLEAETRELLSCAEQLDPEHQQWLHAAAESAALRLRSAAAAPVVDGQLRARRAVSAKDAPLHVERRSSR
jgi:hypothetical protein